MWSHVFLGHGVYRPTRREMYNVRLVTVAAEVARNEHFKVHDQGRQFLCKLSRVFPPYPCPVVKVVAVTGDRGGKCTVVLVTSHKAPRRCRERDAEGIEVRA